MERSAAIKIVGMMVECPVKTVKELRLIQKLTIRKSDLGTDSKARVELLSNYPLESIQNSLLVVRLSAFILHQ